MTNLPLSEKSRTVLQAIAKGHTYEQILVQDLAWTYQNGG
jgi:DNA-binding CsgD family transcriptional regulator